MRSVIASERSLSPSSAAMSLYTVTR
jgi:hypothetical protein